MAEDPPTQSVHLLSFRSHKEQTFLNKPPASPLGLGKRRSLLKKSSYRVTCVPSSSPSDGDVSDSVSTSSSLKSDSSSSREEKKSLRSRSSSLSRFLRRRSPSSSLRRETTPDAEERRNIRLLSFHQRSGYSSDLRPPQARPHGNRFSMMEGAENRKTRLDSVSPPPSPLSSKGLRSPLQNGGDRISQLLQQGGFTHIPPPAGFDSPTRPSTLLEALVRGPVSLDESSLSPLTKRRLAYIHRHAHSTYQIRSQQQQQQQQKTPEKEPREKGAPPAGGKNGEEDDDEIWSDLPTSPLSPPSPFQHPFFRRRLGLLAPEPWSRFSGFGLPRLNPLFRDSPFRSSSSRDSSQPEDTEEGKEGSRRRNARRSKYRMSATNSVLCYCQDTKSYKVCRETQFFSQTYSDGVSETESDDDEDEAYTTPVNSKNLLLHLNNNNHIQANSSSGEDVLPCSSTSTTSSNNNSSNVSVAVGPPSPKFFPILHSPTSEMDVGSKRNSQAISFEADVDEVSSLTTSEPDSFHDAPSPRSSLHSPEFCSIAPCPSYNNDTPQSKEEGEKTPKKLPLNEGEAPLLPPSISSSAQEACSRKEKLHKIALELLHTERSYVDVLHLIDQEFQFRVDQQNRVHHLFPPDQMPLMFANIKSIYKLHHDFLLPQLEERMAQWDSCSRIGDIMKSFAPFLKMYTEYVRNFDNAMTFISSWQAKSHRFAAIMEEIHQMKSCGNLTLQHHMLSPVQRIPRYEMLLRDYLRKLPEDSPDREDTEQALHLVSTAANHANDAMKKIDKFQKLLEVQESLGGAIELVSPTRELLKEGRIIKISARSGDHQERYLFLLSDLLLLCTPRLIGGRVISGPQYRLRARYKVENLEVLEGDNLETANTFYIRDNNKTVELYTQTKEEKELWLSALFQAINETYRRKSSLRLASHHDHKSTPDPDLGHKQPTLIRMDSVTKCMQCGSQFSVVRRKHHCRACGSVVCYKCSNHKASLACESGKNVRVCRTCHETLNEMGSGTSSPSPDTEDKEPDLGGGESSRPDSMDGKKFENLVFRSRGVLEVSANAAGAIMQGFLQLKTHRKAWLKRWFALHEDFVLYSFKNDDDPQALTATPVPGFTVARLQSSKQSAKGESGICEKDREKAFKLYHTKKQYVFLSSTKEDATKWVAALQKASRAELPSPLQ